jgi:acetyltransferase-like isoleucine patch superfamily enzyme
MEPVTGIGGLFVRAKDPEALGRWYADHLGFTGVGSELPASQPGPGPTVRPLPEDSEYFGRREQAWMLSFRVGDLDAMLGQLRAARVRVEDRVEERDHGRFGWATDPEGNRLELWEPASGEPGGDPREAGPESYAQMYRYLVHGDRARLHLHPTAVVNNALFNVGSGHITVGEYAFFGHNVSVLAGTHDITKFGRERQLAIPRSGHDIVIGEGAWLASNVTVLGPSVIGAHAVVGGGSLVLGDVEPYTIVAGSPARVLRTIPHGDRPG